MQPAIAVAGTSAVAHPLQPQAMAPASGNGASPLQPLMLAAWHDPDDVVFLLTKGAQGADIQLQNRRGDSALVNLLLEKKASPDSTDRHGWTAFH